jgi:L-fuconate dehydratase
MEDRAIEFVDHLHEHFLDPVRIRRGRYLAPSTAGFSAEMRLDTLAQYRFPDGAVWKAPTPGA